MDGYGKRLLVVEDEGADRDALAVLFIQAGYNVIGACDGHEALSEMTRRHFDAVVIDHRPPRLDGLEFLSRSRMAWPQTPVILISADHPDLSNEAVQRSAYAWVQKPYEPGLLLEIIRDATGTFRDSGAEPLRVPAMW